MPSSYTTSLRLTLPATGELAGQWGNTVNTGITELLDAAVAGTTTISTWGGAGVAYTLSNNSGTADEARRMFIVATGTPGEAKNVICPSVSKFYVFRNDTTGGFALTLKTFSGTGISVPAGQYKFLYCDGTNVVEAFNSAGALTLSGALSVGGTTTLASNPTLSAGTANQVQYLNASKVLVGSPNMTFNGTDLTVSGAVNAGSVNATTLDLTNLEVTNIKAKDGTASMTLADATGVATFSANPILNAGTANGVLYLNGSKVATSGSALTFDGSDMGVGGAVESGIKLKVFGAVKVQSAQPIYYMNSDNTNNVQIANAGATGGSNGQMAFTLGGVGEQMRLTSTGLGIGTSSPGVKLDVRGSAVGGNFSAISVDNTAAGSGSPANTVSINFSNAGAVKNSITGAVFGDGYLAFATNDNTEKMWLTAAGNLGIGTSSPGNTLDVNGVIRARGDIYAMASGDRIQLLPQSAGNGGIIATANSAFSAYSPMTLDASLYVWRPNGTEQMRLTSTGLGIGTSSPGYKLQVAGAGTVAEIVASNSAGAERIHLLSRNSAGVSYVQSQNAQLLVGTFDNYAMQFMTNNTARMLLDTSGNLGIGTSSPTTRLHVFNSSAGTTDSNSLTLQTAYTAGTNKRNGIAFTDVGNAVVGNIYTQFAGASVDLVFGSFFNGNYQTSDIMRLTGAGNLGLGVTPSAWASNYRVLQMRESYATLASDNGNGVAELTSNAYNDGSWRYANSSVGAVRYQADAVSRTHKWFNAPSGTAGNAISFTQAMTLDASGNLGVGTTSTSGLRLAVDSGSVAIAANFNSTNANGAYIRFQNSGTSIGDLGAGASVFSGGTAGDFGLTSRSGNLVFGTGSIERARITSGGDLLVGTTAQPSGASSRQVVKYDASDYVSYFWNANASPYGVRVQHDTDVNGTGNPFLICVGNATERASIRSNGGIANYSGNNVNLSDRREKTNFAPAKSYLDTICAIPVQTFEYIDQSEDDPGLTLGVVAQDVQAVAPELVMESNWGTEDDPKMRLSIYQTDLQYALMKCIQELKAQNDELRARVAALESQP